MILFVNEKLNMWADWVATGRKVVGLGYPGQVSFMRLTPSGKGLRGPVENEQAWEIERAVHRLDSRLRDVVEQFYLRAGTADSHAKALRIGRSTLFDRLQMAHVKILEYLQVDDQEISHEKNTLTYPDCFDKKQLR